MDAIEDNSHPEQLLRHARFVRALAGHIVVVGAVRQQMRLGGEAPAHETRSQPGGTFGLIENETGPCAHVGHRLFER
jgi:hypothetical protein